MEIKDRPTEIIIKQLIERRWVVRYRNKQTGQRHFCHDSKHRTAYMADIIALRNELRKRYMERFV